MKYNIGVIGCGFVGKAVAKGFAQFSDIKIYDIDQKKATHTFDEVVNCDFVFLCLPTPMISAEGGKANLSIVESCLDDIYGSNINSDAIFIIKSTVPIGKTKEWTEKYEELHIVHSPEFLTARSAIVDFICPARNIVGCEEKDYNEGIKVKKLLEDRFPGTVCFIMKTEESETVKYIANCFFATKVLFFNEMKLLTDKKGLSWDSIMEGVMSDGRIGTSHYEVPGHDGDYGVGGTCVLPDARVNISSSFCYMTDYLTRSDSEYMRNNCFSDTEMTIEKLYDIFQNKIELHDIGIKSCNHDISSTERKSITDVTVREVDEEIYCFKTDNGDFRCTSEHLMPVERDGKIIIIKAKEIKETDKLFSLMLDKENKYNGRI